MRYPLCKEIDGKVVVYTTEVATARGEYIRRRRKCPKCKRRWWTFEVPESRLSHRQAFRAQLEVATIQWAAKPSETGPVRPKYKF